MSNGEYIEQYPQFFKDDIDKWLFKEFNIIGGACSSVEELRYSVAREVAEKAIDYAKEQLMKDSVDGKIVARWPLSSEPLYCDVHIYSRIKDHVKEGDKVKFVIINED